MPRGTNGSGVDGSKPTAFVLNVNVAGLAALRSLARAGAPVVGLDRDPGHAGFFSRYGTAKRCPHPVNEQERLVEFLLEEGRKLEQPGVLSPASDAFALFASRHRDALGVHFRHNLPPPEVMEAAIDKRGLYDLAERCGVPHASLAYPATMEEVHRIKRDLPYPVFVKPHYSHLFLELFPRRGKGFVCRNPKELVATYEEMIPSGVRMMVQSVIEGPSTNLRSVEVYVGRSGEVLGAMMSHKIRQLPTDFGVGTLVESRYEPEFLEMGLRFFRRSGYRGFGAVELKRDDRDGQLKIVDIDARWGRYSNLYVSSRMNFPLIHYLDVIGRPPPPRTAYREGVRWLDAPRDLVAALELMRAGELTPWGWAGEWASARSFALFAADDWGPFLQQHEYGLRAIRGPLRRYGRLGRRGSRLAAFLGGAPGMSDVG